MIKNKSVLFRIILDSTTFILAFLISVYLYKLFNIDPDYAIGTYVSFRAAMVGYLVYMGFIFSSGGYRRRRDMASLSDLVAIAEGSFKTIIIYFISLFLFKIDTSRFLFTSFIILLPLLSVFGRIIANEIFGKYFLKDFSEKTIIYGAGKKGSSFLQSYKRSGQQYLNIVGFLDDNNVDNPNGHKILGKFDELEAITKEYNIERLIVAKKDTAISSLNALRAKADSLNINLSFIPREYLYANNPLKLKDFAGITFSMGSLNDESLTVYHVAKRSMDIIISIMLLVISFPLWPIVCFLVKKNDNGPVFFAQERVGKNYKLFKMYKFRTMYVNTDSYAHCPVDSQDPRITKVGRWLRKTSLDELPQLLNVILGHMSLVGPRPEMPFIVSEYNEIEKQRLRVVPGITGLWQISRGRKAEIIENIEYDLYYIENRGITLDIILLLLTVVFVFRGVAH